MDYQSVNFQKKSQEIQENPKLKGASEVGEPVTIQDAKTCHHQFMMKGIRNMYCEKCGVGYFINGFEDYKRIQSFYNKKYGKNSKHLKRKE